MKQKAFFTIFKGLSIKQITIFLDGKSATLKMIYLNYIFVVIYLNQKLQLTHSGDFCKNVALI